MPNKPTILNWVLEEISETSVVYSMYAFRRFQDFCLIWKWCEAQNHFLYPALHAAKPAEDIPFFSEACYHPRVCRLDAGEPWTSDDSLHLPSSSQALTARGTEFCPIGHCSSKGRGARRWEQQRALCPIKLPGGFQGRPWGKSGWTFRGVYGGMLRKLSILVKSETGISDPFRRKRTWLSVALGHINAHMQSGCLRIKPSIKQGIIHGLWGWQTFTLGHRGLDLLSVTGEWMTGVGVTKEVTRGAPALWSVFKSIKPTQVQADGWIGQYKKPQRDSSLILLIKLCGQGPGVPSRKLHSTFSGNYEFHFGTEQNCLNIPLSEARITGYQCWVC